MTQQYLLFTALFSIVLVIICLLIYNFEIRYNISVTILKRYNPEAEWSAFASKLIGAAVFGLIPLILFSAFTDLLPADYGFSTGRIKEFKGSAVVVLLCIVILSFLVSSLKNIRSRLLKVNIKEPRPLNVILTATGWTIYLFGYELMFRGFLWFTCYDAFGFIPALAINLVLYSLAHYHQGILPSLGAIPAGIVFCLMAHTGGSFIFPFIAHTTMAISFEVFSALQQQGLRLRSEVRNDQ